MNDADYRSLDLRCLWVYTEIFNEIRQVLELAVT
jgi:hypothetical protein